ncbi:MAG: hypothetical protein EA403_02735 [Spirochaetaceae bacterium]|nr:MAG: hypothetical protein EA403_02735 [Spirochaetaceae bacterium]
MKESTTGFDPHWLSLREAVDHAVRPSQLVPRFAAGTEAVRVVDLACGTGSNLRYLSPLLPARQRWLLLDYDAALLAEAGQRCSAWLAKHGRTDAVTLDTRRGDLSAGIPDAVIDPSEGGTHGQRPEPTMVTASALADLVSREWLERFADQLTTTDHVQAVLLATVYNGAVSFDPTDQDDQAVIDAFHRNMHRDKGFGPALGAEAARAVSTTFAQNWAVMEADSTWNLDSACRLRMGAAVFDRLLEFQLGFFVDAATAEGFDASAWGARRDLQRSRDQLTIRVGHTDVLAARPTNANPAGARRADTPSRIPTA